MMGSTYLNRIALPQIDIDPAMNQGSEDSFPVKLAVFRIYVEQPEGTSNYITHYVFKSICHSIPSYPPYYIHMNISPVLDPQYDFHIGEMLPNFPC
jgi:hypothetical protein